MLFLAACEEHVKHVNVYFNCCKFSPKDVTVSKIAPKKRHKFRQQRCINNKTKQFFPTKKRRSSGASKQPTMKNNSFYTSSSRSMHFGGDEYGEYDVTTEYDAPGTTFPRNRIGYDYGHDDSSGMANDDNDDDNDGEDNSSSSLMQQYRGQDTDEMTTETALSALRKQAEARKKRQQVDITSSNGQRQHAVGDLYASAVQMVRGADLTARPGYTPHRMTDSSLLREPLLDGHGHYTAEQSIVSSSDGEISFGRDDVVLSELYKKGEETVQRAIVSDESRMKGVENIIRYLQEREEEYHALHEIGKEELFNQKGVNEEVIFPEKVECGLLDDDELIMIDEDKKSKQGKMVKIANQTFEKIEESDVITVLSDEDGDKSVLYKDDYGDMTRGRKIAIWLSGVSRLRSSVVFILCVIYFLKCVGRKSVVHVNVLTHRCHFF